MAEILVPRIGDRILFLEELEKLKIAEKETSVPCGKRTQHATLVEGPNDVESDIEDPEPGPSTSESASFEDASTCVVWHDLQDYK